MVDSLTQDSSFIRNIDGTSHCVCVVHTSQRTLGFTFLSTGSVSVTGA